MDFRIVKNLLPNIILLEVAIFSAVFIFVGFSFREEDPLFLNTPYSPTMVMALVLSLYYGFPGGIPFLATVVGVSVYAYEDLPVTEIMWSLLIVFLASEFRYYWSRRIRSAELEKEYLQEQISRLRKDLFLLKMSHDQLEFNYIVKPYSLRRMIADLRDRLLREKSERDLVRYFLSVLSQNFQIYKASVYRYSGGKFEHIASIGGGSDSLEENDPLIRMAVDAEETYYLPPKALRRLSADGSGFKYLAVVFASAEEEKFILTIEDMIFVNLNEEVLTHIYILIQYMLEDIVFSRKIAGLYRVEEKKCSFEFVKEYYKMYELNLRVGVQSSVVVFKADDIDPDVRYDLEHAGRALDMVCILEDRGLVVYLLPFTAPVNARNFVKRMLDRYEFLEMVTLRELKEPILEDLLRRVKL